MLEEDQGNKRASKKLNKPTDRDRTTSQLILRGLELGLSYFEVLQLEVGELLDILVEKQNDSYEYAIVATEDDIAREFGG